MELLILPGNSDNNKDWADRMTAAFSHSFSICHAQNYSHWNTEGELIDFKIESEKILQSHISHDLCVLAKSAGVVLALYCIAKGFIKPQKCIFLGMPILWAREIGFDIEPYIKNFNIPTTVIQNSNDPVTSYDEVDKFITKNNLESIVTLIKIDADDHKYDDVEKIKSFL